MTASRSFFAADLVVTGTVTGTGELQVDGRVDGDLTVRTLTVGGRGTLTGTVQAERADIAGALTGALRAVAVTITETGRLSGIVEYERLGVAPGGTFEVECRPTTTPAVAPERSSGPRLARPALRPAIAS